MMLDRLKETDVVHVPDNVVLFVVAVLTIIVYSI